MSYFVLNNGEKNQYQNLSDTHSYHNGKLRSILNSTVVGLCMVLLLMSLWNLSQEQLPNTRIIILRSSKTPLHRTSQKFVSFGLDTSLLRNMNKMPIKDDRFINLARHLSPAYVRVGGTSADCLFFNKILPMQSVKPTSPVDGNDISNFTITNKDFMTIYEFANNTGLRMIFDLNALIRNPDGSWNYTNAKEIILFAKGHEMSMDWQLGNEPNSFQHVFDVQILPQQLAMDYIVLRGLLDSLGYASSILIGPEVNHVGDENHKGEDYARAFLENNNNSVDYVTWHQYYLNGREAKVEDFVNPATFDYLPGQIKSMKQAINASGQKINMWLSETSTAYGSGAPGLSDRFVAGFLWLDKLGYSAKSGVYSVTRQSLFGGNYAMIGPDLDPNPDWWVSVMFQHFVSEIVLEIISPDSELLRLYVHCTPQKALLNRVPAITVYGINLNKVQTNILLQGFDRSVKIFFYALTSEQLTSRKIKLNEELLMLQSNGDLPPFRPRIFNANQNIPLPPYSMNFLVVHGADFPACSR